MVTRAYDPNAAEVETGRFVGLPGQVVYPAWWVLRPMRDCFHLQGG